MPVYDDNRNIVVIGAGVAGIHAALELANKYPDRIIHLCEVSPAVGGTFAICPGRMGVGPHYFDKDTALYYLRLTIEFRKEYPEFFIDHGQAFEKGIYVVVQGAGDVLASIKSPEEVQEVYEAISEEYKRLVEEDPSNKVYGDPQDFLTKLSAEHYPAHINPKIIAAVYQTQEMLLDVNRYIQHLRNQLELIA